MGMESGQISRSGHSLAKEQASAIAVSEKLAGEKEYVAGYCAWVAVARDSASDALRAVVKLLDDEMHALVVAASGCGIDALGVEEKLPGGGMNVPVAAASGCAADTYEAVAKDCVYGNASGAQENENHHGLWLPDAEGAAEGAENLPALLPSATETAHETRGGRVNSRYAARVPEADPACVTEKDLAMARDILNCFHGP